MASADTTSSAVRCTLNVSTDLLAFIGIILATPDFFCDASTHN
jgi:hypothetical protein